MNFFFARKFWFVSFHCRLTSFWSPSVKKGKSILKNNNNNKREEKMTIDCEWRRFSAACRCYPQRIEHIALAFSAPYGPYKDSYKSCGHSGASPQPLIVTENPILYTYLSPRSFLTIDRVTATWWLTPSSVRNAKTAEPNKGVLDVVCVFERLGILLPAMRAA